MTLGGGVSEVLEMDLCSSIMLPRDARLQYIVDDNFKMTDKRNNMHTIFCLYL